MSHGRRLAWLLASVLLGACRSVDPPPSRPMPFHVALAPIQVVEVIDDYDGAGHRLELGPNELERLNANLTRELSASSFVQLTRLESLAAPLGFDNDVSAFLQAARSNTRADLLITFKLRHGTTIYEETNPYIQSAAPFTWLPGPQLWFVPDRRYGARCTLNVYVYDLSRFEHRAGVGPVGIRPWFFSHTVTLSQLYLNYIDRVGWKLAYYLPGLILPSVILDLEDEDFEQDLRELMVDRLAEQLAQELQGRSIDLIRNEHEYGFFLEDQFTNIVRGEDGLTSVEFSLSHKVVHSPNEPKELQLWSEDGRAPLVTKRLDGTDLDEAQRDNPEQQGHARYSFRLRTQLPNGARHLRLRVGDAPRIWREFTFAVPLEAETPEK